MNMPSHSLPLRFVTTANYTCINRQISFRAHFFSTISPFSQHPPSIKFWPVKYATKTLVSTHEICMPSTCIHVLKMTTTHERTRCVACLLLFPLDQIALFSFVFNLARVFQAGVGWVCDGLAGLKMEMGWFSTGRVFFVCCILLLSAMPLKD